MSALFGSRGAHVAWMAGAALTLVLSAPLVAFGEPPAPVRTDTTRAQTTRTYTSRTPSSRRGNARAHTAPAQPQSAGASRTIDLGEDAGTELGTPRSGVPDKHEKPSAKSGEPDADELVWNPDWPRFALPELTFTGAVAAGLVGTYFLVRPPDKPKWQGPVLLDGDMRLGLRASGSGVALAAGISDALLYALVAMPYIDALYALTVRDSPDVAGQMVLINTQSFGITQLVTGLTKNLIARERPYGQDCGESLDGDCGTADRYRSFMSGHASMAFTGAGLVCAHHQYLDLYDDPTADALACAMAVTAATTVAGARVMADKHYLSDVLAGAAVGAVSGYLLPVLLHYGHGGDDDDDDDDDDRDSSITDSVKSSVLPYASPNGFGLSISGTF